MKASCLCKISLPVYLQTGSRYKAPAASHLFATMCTGHSLSAQSSGTVTAMPLAQNVVDYSVSCNIGACVMLICCPDTLSSCCFSHVRNNPLCCWIKVRYCKSTKQLWVHVTYTVNYHANLRCHCAASTWQSGACPLACCLRKEQHGPCCGLNSLVHCTSYRSRQFMLAWRLPSDCETAVAAVRCTHVVASAGQRGIKVGFSLN